MARSKTTSLTCDRCGTCKQARRSEDEWPWGQIQYRQINGPIRVNGSENRPGAATFADICPSCLAELHTWWTTLPEKEASHADA